MMNPALRPDASLSEFLVARARAASDGRLVLDVVGGSLLAIGVATWRPTGWISLAGVALSLVAFGFWGIADRELRERAHGSSSATVRVLRAVRAAATLVGVLSALTALFAGLGVALGVWIS
ncbi:MAG: hypothetical protein DMD35_12715 [Gemmatimonadetes bacterium]|nr:MAG: hypothetical protein DMD35_12715 [Gemmatimonadota bacterium]